MSADTVSILQQISLRLIICGLTTGRLKDWWVRRRGRKVERKERRKYSALPVGFEPSLLAFRAGSLPPCYGESHNGRERYNKFLSNVKESDMNDFLSSVCCLLSFFSWHDIPIPFHFINRFLHLVPLIFQQGPK